MRAGGLAASVVLLLGACAAPKALLLPAEEGQDTGALAVLDADGAEQVLDRPLLRARMGRGGTSVRSVSTLKPAYRQLMAGLPPPQQSYSLYFVEGTTRLVPSSRPVLDRIKVDFVARPGAEVQVTGHTDTVGSEEDNDRLSMARAREVMGVLIAEGFPEDVMSAVGRGERSLAVQTGDGVANVENRRVEVIVR